MATFAIVAGSCSSSNQRSTTDTTIVEQIVDDVTIVPDTTTPPPDPSTSPPPTTPIDAPAGVIVARTLEINEQQAPPVITGLGTGFVRLQSTSPSTPVAVSTSADGVNWTAVQSDIKMTYASHLVVNGGSLVAVGSGGDPQVSDRMTVWTSSDGGTHWTMVPIETRQSDAKYVRFDQYVEAVAVTNGLVILAGREMTKVDWQSYSIDVFGEDHGQVTGEGTVGDGTIRVSFEDGVDLTVEAADVGLDSVDPMAMTVTLWTSAEGVWPATEQPMGFLQGQMGIGLASGPNGVLAVSTPSFEAGQGNGFAALRTLDGRTWETAPLPDELRMQGAAQVGGPLGYVVVGADVLYHSADGVTFTEVHRFEDLDVEGTQMGFATATAAGQAGFAVGVPDMAAAGPSWRAFTSTDGIAWNETLMPEGVESVLAVSDAAILVQPFVRVSTTPELPPGVDGMRDALVSAFSGVVAAGGTESLIAPDEVECIADGLLESVGEERLRAIGFGAYPWSLLGYGLGLPIDRTDAEPMVETFMSCAPRWELLIITSITQGAENISESSAECTAAALDDDFAAEVFVDELAREDLDAAPGTADLSYLGDVQAAMEGCLTPTEMNSIDFS